MKEIEFVKQVPSHPRDRLKRTSRKPDFQFIKQIPIHPRDRLERMVKDKEVKFVKQVPAHPRYRLQRGIRDSTAKVSVDKNVLQDLPYFNQNIKVNEAEKNKGSNF